MLHAIGICSFLLTLHMVQGFKIETTDNWTLSNDQIPSTDIFSSRAKLYHGRVSSGKLSFYSVEKENRVNCTSFDEKLKNISFDYTKGIKHLENGKALLFSPETIVILNTSSCSVDGVVENDCKIIFPRVHSFDCYPKSPPDNFTMRYSDEGRLIRNMTIDEVHGTDGESSEFGDVQGTSFTWQHPTYKKFWSALNVVNSTFDMVQLDYLIFERVYKHAYFSTAHESFTGCIPWFNVEPCQWEKPEGNFIECTLVCSKNGTTSNVTVSIGTPAEVKEKNSTCKFSNKHLIGVHNLNKEGAVIVLYNAQSVQNSSKRVYYRIIYPQGQISQEEIFYEFANKYESTKDIFSIHVYEKDGSVCGVFVDYYDIVTKCVKITLDDKPGAM